MLVLLGASIQMVVFLTHTIVHKASSCQSFTLCAIQRHFLGKGFTLCLLKKRGLDFRWCKFYIRNLLKSLLLNKIVDLDIKIIQISPRNRRENPVELHRDRIRLST